jgi:hypothetical protein
MFFIIAEYVTNLCTNVVRAAQVVKVIKIIPDIEVGIKTDIPLVKDGYEWDIKIPDCFSTQDELDKLV